MSYFSKLNVKSEIVSAVSTNTLGKYSFTELIKRFNIKHAGLIRVKGVYINTNDHLTNL
jgi:cAMP phosphodiesterase